MKKLIFLCLFFPIYAFAQNCKPEITSYQVADNSVAVIENKLAHNLSLFIPVPKQIITDINLTIFTYEKDRVINHFQLEEMEGYKPNLLYLRAFNLDTGIDIDDKVLAKIRKAWNIDCSRKIQEIRTANTNYRVILMEKNKEINKNNVFIIPIDHAKKTAYFVQFGGFSEKEIGATLSTIK